jgi:hypothetical protein
LQQGPQKSFGGPLFDREEYLLQGRKVAMREDALVREKTLMDVLKSVTRSDSIETILTCKSLAFTIATNVN